MSSDDTHWLPPDSPSGPDRGTPEDRPVPRFGQYGTPPAGQMPAEGAPGQEQNRYGAGAGQSGDSSSGSYSRAYGASYGSGGPGTPDAPWMMLDAPRPGIIPLRPLGITEIISGAFEALRANPRAMFLPSILIMSGAGLVTAIFTYLFTESTITQLIDSAETNDSPRIEFGELASGLTPLLGTAIISELITIVLTGLLIVAVSRSVLGRLASPGDVWKRTRPRIWALLGQSLLIIVITSATALVVIGGATWVLVATVMDVSTEDSTASTFLGLALFFLLVVATVVAVFYFTVRLWLASAALILEGVGVWEGIRRSWTLTRGSFWRILGIFLLSGLISATANGLLSGAESVLVNLAMLALPDVVSLIVSVQAFFSYLITAVILPFSASVTALTYIDMRMRHEGLDVELRRAAG